MTSQMTSSYFEPIGRSLYPEESKTTSTLPYEDLHKTRPLFITELGPNSNIDEILKNLKPLPKNPHMLKLIASFAGPKDMSANKRKYITGNAKSKR